MGSFSRAAETLFLSQPAISAQIKDLEYGYGGPLFNRIGRKIELTPAGEVLLHYAENILKIYDESKYAVNCLKEYNQGRITLGSSTFPGTHYLPPLLAEYLRDNPEVRLAISVKNPKKIKEMVLKKELERLGEFAACADNSAECYAQVLEELSRLSVGSVRGSRE